jgi:hypothetical protein
MTCVGHPSRSSAQRIAVRVGRSLGKSKRFVVVVQDDDIIVGLLGFYAVYYKPSNQPQLILRRRSETDDHELLAQAWQAANDKARELGWIV